MAKVTKIVEIANDDEDDDDIFGEDSIDALTGLSLDEDDDHSSLRAVARLAKLVGSLPWFSAVGRKLTAAEINDAEAYIAGIGFAEMQVAVATADQALLASGPKKRAETLQSVQESSIEFGHVLGRE